MEKWQRKHSIEVGGADGVAASTGRIYRGYVERQTLALPAGTYAAVPGPPELGGGFVDNTQAGLAKYVANTAEQATYAPLLVPLRHEQGAVRGIAIAADSPISCADLWLGDRTQPNRYRIAPGRPFLGDLSALDHLLVTLPRALPSPWDDTDIVETLANWQLCNFVWDAMSSSPGNSVSPQLARADMSFPLRLELYRGDFPASLAQTKRAPYYADMAVSIDTAQVAGATHERLWVVTDGRASVEVVIASTDASACQVTITGHDPVLANRAMGATFQTLRRDVPFVQDSFALPANGTFKRTYTAPFMMYSIDLAVIGTTVTAAVSVVARDAP